MTAKEKKQLQTIVQLWEQLADEANERLVGREDTLDYSTGVRTMCANDAGIDEGTRDTYRMACETLRRFLRDSKGGR